jgi:hypothetical protein
VTNILIMTATVTPNQGLPGLIRSDPAVRLQDYRRSLASYLALLGRTLDAIVFVENSNADLLELHDLAAPHADKVEFIVFHGTDHPPAYGRCYAEAELLDYAMAHSQTVAAAGPHAVFWKVTGRYHVKNLPQLIRHRPKRFDFYCDLRRFRAPWADMRLMAWTKAGHAQIFQGIGPALREDLNNGRPGEESLYRELSRRILGRQAVTRLTREPLIDGVRAFDNANWSSGRRLAVYYMRQAQRLVLGRVLF